MASLQSHLLSYMLRRDMKRRKPSLSVDEARYVAAARRNLNNPKLIPKEIPPNTTIKEFDVDEVRGEWVEHEQSDANKVLIYCHGGGFIGGSVKTYRKTTTALAKYVKRKVMAIEYRLAPEHRFPAAVKDAVRAYYLALETTEPRNIAFAGDSAGGGLAVAALLSACEQGLPLPSCVVCYSPFADMTATGKSLDTNDKRCAMFYGDSIRRVAPIYLGDADPKNPLASPIYGDLSKLPPMQIFVSNSEVLLDDSIRLAAKAKADGVKVDLQIWKSQPHVWAIFPFLPDAKKALRMTADFINKNSK